MTPDEIGKLKSELHTLNCHIQAERNDEVRHSLQRGRLEAERAQTLAKLVEAYAAVVSEQPKLPAEMPSVSCISPRSSSPYLVTVGPKEHPKNRPLGIGVNRRVFRQYPT